MIGPVCLVLIMLYKSLHGRAYPPTAQTESRLHLLYMARALAEAHRTPIGLLASQVEIERRALQEEPRTHFQVSLCLDRFLI